MEKKNDRFFDNPVRYRTKIQSVPYSTVVTNNDNVNATVSYTNCALLYVTNFDFPTVGDGRTNERTSMPVARGENCILSIQAFSAGDSASPFKDDNAAGQCVIAAHLVVAVAFCIALGVSMDQRCCCCVPAVAVQRCIGDTVYWLVCRVAVQCIVLYAPAQIQIKCCARKKCRIQKLLRMYLCPTNIQISYVTAPRTLVCTYPGFPKFSDRHSSNFPLTRCARQ